MCGAHPINFVQVSVTNDDGSSSSVTLPASLHSLGKALWKGDMNEVVVSIFNNPELADAIVNQLTSIIDAECSTISQRSVISPFRKMSINEMVNFQWSTLIDDLSVKAPTLYRILSSVVAHSDSRNKVKLDATHAPGLCMTTAVLLKERNREICGVQSIVSMLLHYSHAEKQVCSYISNLM